MELGIPVHAVEILHVGLHAENLGSKAVALRRFGQRIRVDILRQLRPVICIRAGERDDGRNRLSGRFIGENAVVPEIHGKQKRTEGSVQGSDIVFFCDYADLFQGQSFPWRFTGTVIADLDSVFAEGREFEIHFVFGSVQAGQADGFCLLLHHALACVHVGGNGDLPDIFLLQGFIAVDCGSAVLVVYLLLADLDAVASGFCGDRFHLDRCRGCVDLGRCVVFCHKG